MRSPAPPPPPSPAPDRGGNLAGRLFLAGLGLSLALIGGLFVAVMGSSFARAKAMESWPVVECVILESEVEEVRVDPLSPPQFRHRLLYGYEWEGRRLTSDLYELRDRRFLEAPLSADPRLARERADLLPLGSVRECRVDPADPETAVIRTDSKGPGYAIWFPGLFVVGGLGILIRAILPRRRALVG